MLRVRVSSNNFTNEEAPQVRNVGEKRCVTSQGGSFFPSITEKGTISFEPKKSLLWELIGTC